MSLNIVLYYLQYKLSFIIVFYSTIKRKLGSVSFMCIVIL